MTVQEFAAYFDHTLLRPNVGAQDIDQLCDEAREYGFRTVCVHPVWVSRAAAQVTGSQVDVCSVVGFPLGQHMSAVKAQEARIAVAEGAAEIDMVIRLDAVLERDDRAVRDDITAVVEASYPALVKVIIETCYLSDEEKQQACRLAIEAGAAYVKTSTGFGSGGATVEDIRLMRAAVGPHIGVKASGGIRTAEQALELLAAGATRVGASSSVSIVRSMEGA